MFFLPPGHAFGQETGESVTYDFLFDGLARTHLGGRVEPHGHVEELLVEERYASFHSPCREGLVGPQAVVKVQFGEFAHSFLVEGPCVWCLVEIEVTAEYLVGSFAAKHHLDAHALDDAGKQVHRGGGAHGGHVVGLDVVDDITHGIQTLLNGVVDFVVYGTDMVGHFPGLGQVRCAFQSHGEAVELRPPRHGLAVGLNAACRKLPRYG